MSQLKEILEEVFNYGVGTNADDIKGNDQAYLNLKKHAIRKGELRIKRLFLDYIDPNKKLEFGKDYEKGAQIAIISENQIKDKLRAKIRGEDG